MKITSILAKFKLLRLFVNFCCFAWLFINKKESKNYNYTVVICAIFKNESNYLREWIEHHRLIGVQHFYLYNNESTDNYMHVIKNYISSGIVTLIDFSGKGVQYEAYKHCMENNGARSNWMGFIDIDEFICIHPRVFKERALANINNVLTRYSYLPSIKFYWQQFGTSGIQMRDMNSLVTESFTSCEPLLVNNNWTNCFINMNFRNQVDSHGIHNFDFYFRFLIWKVRIPSFGEYFFSDYISRRFRTLSVNHYCTKSLSEFQERNILNGRASRILKDGEYSHSQEYPFRIDFRCTERNHDIQRFCAELKSRLNEN